MWSLHNILIATAKKGNTQNFAEVLHYTGTAPLFKNVITRKVNKYLILNSVHQ